MSEIDDRIVSMTFDNESFERRLSETIQSLDKLTSTIEDLSSTSGLDGLSESVNSFDASHMSDAIDSISEKFSALGAIGFTVIQDLTRSVIDMAKQTGQDILGPILSGGKSRAGNIEQAKFLFRGMGIDVNAGMASALDAVKGTAFGLDEAAKAAAQFGASGIKVGEKMTGALRGVAGAAAMTGSSFKEIADIFAGSAGTGKVTNMDLMQFATRGLNASAALAKVMGKSEAQIHEMATKGKLDFKTFAEAMDKAFGQHAKKANETYSGSLANMHAAMSRLGASFLGPQMEQQRDLFNALTPVIDNVSSALAPLLLTFLQIRKAGVDKTIGFLAKLDLSSFALAIGRIAEGIRSVNDLLKPVVTVFKEAFRDIFPKQEVSLFLKFAQWFADFTAKIKMGGETLDKFKSIFSGFFAVLEIGWTIVKELFGVIKDLFSNLSGAGGGIFDFAASTGNALVALNEALVAGGGIADFFKKLSDIIHDPIKYINQLKDSLLEVFHGGSIPGMDVAESTFGRIGQRFEMLRDLAKKVGDAWAYLSDKFEGVRNVLGAIWDYISNWFSELGSKLAAVMQPGDFNEVIDALNVGLIGGIALFLRKLTNGGFKLDFSNGLFEKISESLDALTGKLKAMQTNLKATALLKIAGAVAILTVSLVALSLIDSVALTKALTAMAVGFGQLVGAMALLDQISSTTGALKIGLLASGMIILATAVTILTVAVRNLSGLSWQELAKGLLGVTVLMAGLVAATNLIAEDVGGLIRAGIAMMAISVALLILSEAVKSFAEMSWTEMAKGLLGVAVGLALITTSMNLMPASGMASAGIGMALIATGLLVLSEAVKAFADIPWGDMAKGFVGVAAGLIIIAGAMHLMPKDMFVSSAAILVLSAALLVMAKAVEAMGSIKFGDLAKGLGAFIVLLTALSIAMTVMTGTAAGAAALLIVSGAMLILTHVLKELSQLSLQELAMGLGAIAAVLAVLGVGALLLGGVLPELLGLGIALGLLGVAFALFGAGAALVAKAFEIMAESGKAGAKAIIEAIKLFIGAVPGFAEALVVAILQLAKQLLEAAPILIKGLRVILGQLIDTVTELAPKIGEALTALIKTGLKMMQELTPELVTTGFTLLMSLLKGVRDNIVEITNTVIEIMTAFATTVSENAPLLVQSGIDLLFAFLNAISERIQSIVDAGVNLVVNFLLGISNSVDRIVEAATFIIINFMIGLTQAALQLAQAGADILIALLSGISNNIIKVADTVTSIITQFITTMGENALDIAQAGTDALVAFLKGIGDNLEEVVTTVGDLIEKFITAVSDEWQDITDAGLKALKKFLFGIENNLSEVITTARKVANKLLDSIAENTVAFADAAFETLTNFLNELAAVIRRRSKELQDAGKNIAMAVADGFTFGLASKAKNMADSVVGAAKGAWEAGKSWLGINSPSRKFMELGAGSAEGFAKAMNDDTSAKKSAVSLASRALKGFQDTLSKIPDTISGMDNFNPVITPVLDLTKVQSASKGLDRLMSISSLTPDVSYATAKDISAINSARATESEGSVQTGPTEIKFEQNNYSPAALSTSEIYRNTKSQIALAKEELSIS